MNSQSKNILFFFFITAVIMTAVYFIVKRIIERTGENINDGLSNITGGYVRTIEAKRAQSEIDKMPFLKYLWSVNAERKYNKLPYEFPNWIGTDKATQVSNSIIDAKSLAPGGLFNDSYKALTAIKEINTWADAVQVTISYHNTTGRNLSAGLEWLNSECIIEARDHFQGMTTGVYLNGQELDKNQIIV